MTDWLSPMKQTFEYYTVDPGTWKDVKRIDSITSATISRDSSADTLGSATFEIGESIGETYVRTYLVTVQNGITERHPLGTHLVQTPSKSFDGMVSSYSLDAYTPLIELKEKQPPLGYFTPEAANVMTEVSKITKGNLRAPVVAASSDVKVYKDFVANTDDTWITYLNDLMANAKFYFDIDEQGNIMFAPQRNLKSLQPIWTFDDGNSSILQPSVSYEEDLYGIPNVVEVVYSDSSRYLVSRVVNDDPNSPTSTVKRGREIPHRETNPDFSGLPSQHMLDEYAEQLLESLSTVTCTVSYTHGYCPVRLGDCVRLNYTRAGITDVKALVTSQSIKCEPGTPVSEKAVFTKKLWG